MNFRTPILLAAAAVSLLWTACTDEECTLQCGPGFECGFSSAGDESCLETCGNDLCQDNETCTNNQCVVSGNTSCPTGQHAVSGNCIPNYTATNACDPLVVCRRQCGGSPGCLQACTDDASAACTTLLSAISSCESRQNCTADAQNCCADEFCAAFVSNSSCGNTPACDTCAQEAGDDINRFNECAEDEPACASCLLPFFNCRDTGGSNCTDFFCDCVSPEYCSN
jgi:hypothetical protein